MRIQTITLSLSAFAAASVALPAQIQIDPVLLCQPPQISPAGPYADPGDVFSVEHYLVTAGTSLQGNRHPIKYAPVLVPWNQLNNPLDPNGNVADFQTVFVVDNPDPNQTLTVDVDFFNADGSLSATLDNLTIAPSGHLQREISDQELQGPNGMICVRVDNQSLAPDFVGATIYFASQVVNPFDLQQPLNRLERAMSSMQPLQELQAAPLDEVHFGPIPVRLLSGIDSLNGLLSFQNVVNPSPQPNNITVTVRSPIAGMTQTMLYTIPANGTLTLYDAWNYAVNAYPTLTLDHDVVVHIKSTSGLPILGESIFLDLFRGNAGGGSGGGPGGSPLVGGEPGSGSSQVLGNEQGVLWERGRMSSMMLAYQPSTTLVNPEIIDNTTAVMLPMQTTIGISNVAATNAGPVIIDYFDNLGNAIGTDVVTSLPQWQSVVLGAGLLASPNFPTGSVFKASAHIRTCSGKLIGWANRASESTAGLLLVDAPKMYGELLHRCGGVEHAIGWIEGTLRTKIAPLVLHDVNNVIPSYVTFANQGRNLTNAYAYTFFDPTGVATGFAAFANLPFRTTSFSYLEGLITQPSPVGGGGSFSDIHHHGGFISNRVNFIEGIQTIGGRIDFYLRFEGGLPVYPGPGDTL